MIEIVLKSCQHMGGERSRSGRNGDSVQKIAASNAAIHSKLLVSRIISQVVLQISVVRFCHGPLAHFGLKSTAVI